MSSGLVRALEGTVQTGRLLTGDLLERSPPAMTLPTPDEIRQRMHTIRGDVNENMQALVDQAQTITDWRYYVRQHPWLCLGAAALAGYLLIPRRPQVVRPDPIEIERMIEEGRIQVKATAQPKTPSLAESLFTMLSGAALRFAVQYATSHAAELLQGAAPASTPMERQKPRSAGGSHAHYNGLHT